MTDKNTKSPLTGSVPSPSWTEIGSSHKPLNHIVTDALRQAILHGEFKPGDRLREVRLAEMFNVSRNPIRESLRILQAEGLVEISPRKGARVPLLSLEEVAEIIELRADLEGMSAKYAAKRCTPESRETLQSLLDKGNNAEQENNIELLQEVNHQFHSLLAKTGKNRFLADFMRSLQEKTLRLFSNATDERISENWKEHAEILEAVISADEELSSALAMRHVKRVGEEAAKEINKTGEE